MENQAFENFKASFASAGTDDKIDMFISAEDLTQPQYRELLKLFPLNELARLEAALG